NGNNDVVLQNVKVLAVDQLADDSAEKPTVVKAVTLEVETVAAQKLSLAASLGNLTLALRKAGETDVEGTRRITQSDLGNQDTGPRSDKRYATVTVTRGAQRQEYSVATEGKDWREAVDAVRR